MALLWTDGFDNYGSDNTTVVTTLGIRGYSCPNGSYDDDTGRIDGRALLINYIYATGIEQPNLNTTNETLICGFGWKTENYYSSDRQIFGFFNGSDNVSLLLTSTGALKLKTGTSDLATSTNDYISLNTWHHIEWKFTVGTNSAYVVKVDGVTWLSGTGNTKAGSSNYYNGFRLMPVTSYSGGGSYSQWFDDLYIFDAAGLTNNDLVGDCKIVTIYPTSDNSCNFATLSTGSNHYALVDDQPYDADSTYVEDSTTGNKDILGYSDVSDANTVLGLGVITVARKTDTDAMSIRSIIKSGSTENASSNLTLTTDYTSIYQLSEADPNTSSAWTQSSVNSALFGFEIV